jgi:hypothetical protein
MAAAAEIGLGMQGKKPTKLDIICIICNFALIFATKQ